MGISFFASKAPENRSDLAGWVLGRLSVDVTGTSAVHLLAMLGVSNPVEQAEGGEMTPEEMLLRLSVAQSEGGPALMTARFGQWHTPGYFETRLGELAEVAHEAEELGGVVAWS